jgi:glycosyltransferase involved in cell wall biosynthesis
MIAQRILICLHDFTRGGTERVAIHLARLWFEAGREVIILCGNEDGGLRDSVDTRVRVQTFDPPIHRGLLSRLRLGRAMGRELAKLKPDVIFLPGNYHALLAGGLRHADARPAIVLKISNPPLPSSLPGWLIGPIFRYLTRGVNGFAVMNAGLARELARIRPGGHIATLRDPVNISQVAPVHRRDEPYRILWVGRLEPQKDVLLALRVIQALNARMPAHLTLLGDGALAGRTGRAIREMGLERHVTRIDQVSAMGPCFAAADALLITSHYEGGPAVAVEALMQGVPVVSTDCSHLLREVITDPQAGSIVSSRDAAKLSTALELVLRGSRPHPGTLATLVAGFMPTVCAHAYLEFFDSLAGNRHAD